MLASIDRVGQSCSFQLERISKTLRATAYNSEICIDRRRYGAVITNSRSLYRAKCTACRSLVGA